MTNIRNYFIPTIILAILLFATEVIAIVFWLTSPMAFTIANLWWVWFLIPVAIGGIYGLFLLWIAARYFKSESTIVSIAIGIMIPLFQFLALYFVYSAWRSENRKSVVPKRIEIELEAKRKRDLARLEKEK